MDIDDLPGGLSSKVQMHMLSVDVSNAVLRSGNGCWRRDPTDGLRHIASAGFPAYAKARVALTSRDKNAADMDKQESRPSEELSHSFRSHANGDDFSPEPFNASSTAKIDPFLCPDSRHDAFSISVDEDDDRNDDPPLTFSGRRSASTIPPRTLPTHQSKIRSASSFRRDSASASWSPNISDDIRSARFREMRCRRQASVRRARAVQASVRSSGSGMANFRGSLTCPPKTPSATPCEEWTHSCFAVDDSAARASTNLCGDEAAEQFSESTCPTKSFSSRYDGESSGESDDHVIGGYLRKRGRRSRMRKLRFFTVDKSFLRSHKNEHCVASWSVDLRGALIGVDNKTCRIVIMLDSARRMVLYAQSAQDAQLWADAFASASECDDYDYDWASNGKKYASYGNSKAASRTSTADPTSDIWDTFRSFSALAILTRKQSSSKRAHMEEIDAHEIYNVLVE